MNPITFYMALLACYAGLVFQAQMSLLIFFASQYRFMFLNSPVLFPQNHEPRAPSKDSVMFYPAQILHGKFKKLATKQLRSTNENLIY